MVEAAKYLVYGLLDPRDGELRYVGKTERPLAIRLDHHVHRAVHRKSNTHKACWIRKVIRETGRRPIIKPLAICRDAQELNLAEVRHIAFWRERGCRLTNLTDGGEGTAGFHLSPEARRKLSERFRGKPNLAARRPPDPRVVELYKSGKSTLEIGRMLGLSHSGVCKHLIRAGVPRRTRAEQDRLVKFGPKPKLLGHEDEVVAQYLAGDPASKIARGFRVEGHAVCAILHARGIQFRNAGVAAWTTRRRRQVP